MKTVILHVGMHKTGTTSIQKSLDSWREDGGVRYVDLGIANHGHAIQHAFMRRGGAQTYRRNVAMGRSRLDEVILRWLALWRLRRELSRSNVHTFVISGEGISSLPIEALQELKATLLRLVDRVVVFAYIRDPVSYSVSMYQQQVRTGKARYRLDVARYRHRFEKCLEVFGHENFVARVFDPKRFPKGSVVTDFCQYWGIPLDAQGEKRANESLSMPAAQLLQLFNQSGVPSSGSLRRYVARYALVGALAEHFKGREKFSLPPRFLGQRLVQTADMDWLDQQWGIRFAMPKLREAAVPPGRLREFMGRVDPQDIASYRNLLDGLGISTSPEDTPTELVCKHYAVLYRKSWYASLIPGWLLM